VGGNFVSYNVEKESGGCSFKENEEKKKKGRMRSIVKRRAAAFGRCVVPNGARRTHDKKVLSKNGRGGKGRKNPRAWEKGEAIVATS